MTDDAQARLENLMEQLLDDHTRLLRGLVAMRKNAHLTQADVAERMGVSQPVVSDFERYDANPTLSTIRRYALAVGARTHTQVTADKDSEESSARPTPSMMQQDWVAPAGPVMPTPDWGKPRIEVLA
jgi:transcriptional regulator with XRE-family HTH domain